VYRLIYVLLPMVLILVIMFVGMRIGRQRGYTLGPDTIVRCSEGHLFTTIWMPGGSFKAIRLGWSRYQHCPVGDHWTFVTPVRDDELTDAERLTAEQYRDGPIP